MDELGADTEWQCGDIKSMEKDESGRAWSCNGIARHGMAWHGDGKAKYRWQRIAMEKKSFEWQ